MSDTMSAPRISASKGMEAATARKPRACNFSENARKKTSSKRNIEPLGKIERRNENSFGIRLALIRVMLGQTQESFAELMMTNRQAVALAEKCAEIDDLKDGMVFRVYYFLNEAAVNNYFASEIRQLASSLLKEVRAYIADRTN